MKLVKKVLLRAYVGRGRGAKAIIWFTRGKYSHNSMVFIFDDGSCEEIEAIQGKGVIAHKPLSRKEHEFDDFIIPFNSAQRKKAYRLAKEFADNKCKYDWRGVFGFITRKKKPDLTKMFCCEMVGFICYKVRWPLSRREPYKETPTSTTEAIGRVFKVRKDLTAR